MSVTPGATRTWLDYCAESGLGAWVLKKFHVSGLENLNFFWENEKKKKKKKLDIRH